MKQTKIRASGLGKRSSLSPIGWRAQMRQDEVASNLPADWASAKSQIERDRRWFAAHSKRTVNVRPVYDGEIEAEVLKNPGKGVFSGSGKFPYCVVTQLEPGVRTRRYILLERRCGIVNEDQAREIATRLDLNH